MMRKIGVVLAGLVIVAMVASPARADLESDAKAEWNKAYASWKAATDERNGANYQYALADAVVTPQSARFSAYYSDLSAGASEGDWVALTTAMYAAWNYGSAAGMAYADGKTDYDAGEAYHVSGTKFAEAKQWGQAYACFSSAWPLYDKATPQFKDAAGYYATAKSYGDTAKGIMDKYVP